MGGGIKPRPAVAASFIPQTVHIRHADAAGDGADDAHEPLVGAADEEVVEVGAAVELLLRRAVDGAVVVAGEADDCRRGEHIGVDDPSSVVLAETDYFRRLSFEHPLDMARLNIVRHAKNRERQLKSRNCIFIVPV